MALHGRAAPDRLVCSTPWSALADSVPPAACVSHVSRCGSTLITQALATVPQCIVMSEPPCSAPSSAGTTATPGHSGGVRTLQRLAAAQGHRRDPAARHLDVGFDCWHLPWMPLVQAAFPGTPTVFLYRQPQEVLASHRHQRGLEMAKPQDLVLMDYSQLPWAIWFHGPLEQLRHQRNPD